MDYLPNDIYSWLYFIIILFILTIIILQAVRWGAQKKYPVIRTQWKYYVWVVLAIICNVFFQIQLNATGMRGGSGQYLPTTMYVLGLLPLIIVAYHGDFVDTGIIALVSAISQLISGKPNLFIIPFFIGFGLLVRYLSLYTPHFLQKQRIRHPVISVLWAMIIVYPFAIFNALFFTKAGLLIRIGAVLTGGQWYWFHWLIPALIGGLFCELTFLAQKKGEYRTHLNPSKNAKMLEELVLLFFVSFVLISAQWQVFISKNYASAQEQLKILGGEVVEEYSYFIEVGKSIISSSQENVGLSNGVQPEKVVGVLAEIYHQVPFFEELSLFQGDQKFATYPGDISTLTWMKDTIVQNRIQEIVGTEIPYRVDTYLIENEGVMYYFYTPIRNSEFVLLGITRPETNLFFSFDSRYYDPDGKFAWLLTDSLGGQLKGTGSESISNLVYEEILQKAVHDENDGQRFFTNFGNGYFTTKQSGDYTCTFSGIILEENIIRKTFRELLPVLGFELFILLSAIGLTKKHSKTIESEVALLSKKGISPEEIDSYVQDGVLNHPALIRLYSNYKIKLSGLVSEISRERNSLKVIQDLSRVDSIDDIVDTIVKNKYLSSMGSLRLVLNPEIAYFLGHGRKTSSFGTGKILNQYAHLDFELYSKMKNEQLRIISNCAKSEWLDQPGKGVMPGSLTIFSLRSHDIYFGIVWVADFKAKKIDPIDIRFFNTVANQISVSLANMYVYRIEESHKARTEFLIQSLPEPVLVMNRMLQLVLINSAAKKMTRVFESEASAGMSIEKFVHDPTLIQFLRQTIENKVISGQLALVNGREYSVNLVVAAEKTWYQNDWIICTLHDISTFREKDEIRSDFLGTVGQYLQTPLHLTSGYLAMLPMVGDLNQAQKDYIDSISRSVQKMDSFVNDLLDINRISSGLGLEYKLVCATDMINDVVIDLTQLAKQRHVKIISSDLPRRLMSKIELDEKLFYQALYNLVKNGIENNLMAGEVEIKLKVEGGELLFVIKDTGAGIAPLDIPNIFKKVQYQSSHGGAPGGGLELSLVKSIIDRHHGDVWVESELGKGSVFYIRVPRVPQEKSTLN